MTPPAGRKRGAFVRTGRAVAVVALVVVLVGLAAGRADAHAQLTSTEPSPGASLDRSPAQVVLRFNEAVSVTSGGVRVFNGGRERVDRGGAHLAPGEDKTVQLALPPLPAGAYVVAWRAVSADSHPVRGAFTFRVGQVEAASPATVTELGAGGGASRPVSVLFGVARTVLFAALALLVGGGWFLVFVWPAGLAGRPARRLWWAGWAAATVATIATWALQGLYAAGLGLGSIVDGSVWSDVAATRYGWCASLRVLLLGVTALAAVVAARSGTVAPANTGRGRSVVGAVALVLGLGVLATVAFAGHAATGPWPAGAFLLDVVHLAAMATWLGGLAMVAVILAATRAAPTAAPLPAAGAVAVGGRRLHMGDDGDHGPDATGATNADATNAGAVNSDATNSGAVNSVNTANSDADDSTAAYPDAANTGTKASDAMDAAGALAALRRFSAVAFGAVVVIVGSGVAQSVRQLGGFDGLHTHYGRLVIMKVAVVAAIIVVASRSRRLLRAQLRSPGAGGDAPRAGGPSAGGPSAGGPTVGVARLRRPVLAEVALAVVVLAVTALLVNAPPGRDAIAKPASLEIVAGDVLAEITVDPARRGPTDLHVYLVEQTGATARVANLSVQLALPAADVGPLDVVVEPTGPGHYAAYGFDLPLAGTWTITVSARTDDVTEVSGSGTFTAR